MMGLTPGPLVHTLLPLFLCVLMIPLVVLVAWGLEFLHQHESSPNLIFWFCRVRTNRSRIQRWSTHHNVLALKSLVIFPNLKLSFIVIVMVWIWITHSYRCRFTKNTIQSNPMWSIRRPSDYCSGSTEANNFFTSLSNWSRFSLVKIAFEFSLCALDVRLNVSAVTLLASAIASSSMNSSHCFLNIWVRKWRIVAVLLIS